MNAKSQAQRARDYRQRKKLRVAGLLPEREATTLPSYPKQTLSGYLADDRDRWESVDWVREEVGLKLGFLLEPEGDGDQTTEIKQIDGLIASLITSLEALTAIRSEYEIAQIDGEIERLKSTVENDRESMNTAISSIVQLKEIRKQLEKKFRLSLAGYEIKV